MRKIIQIDTHKELLDSVKNQDLKAVILDKEMNPAPLDLIEFSSGGDMVVVVVTHIDDGYPEAVMSKEFMVVSFEVV